MVNDTLPRQRRFAVKAGVVRPPPSASSRALHAYNMDWEHTKWPETSAAGGPLRPRRPILRELSHFALPFCSPILRELSQSSLPQSATSRRRLVECARHGRGGGRRTGGMKAGEERPAGDSSSIGSSFCKGAEGHSRGIQVAYKRHSSGIQVAWERTRPGRQAVRNNPAAWAQPKR